MWVWRSEPWERQSTVKQCWNDWLMQWLHLVGVCVCSFCFLQPRHVCSTNRPVFFLYKFYDISDNIHATYYYVHVNCASVVIVCAVTSFRPLVVSEFWTLPRLRLLYRPRLSNEPASLLPCMCVDDCQYVIFRLYSAPATRFLPPTRYCPTPTLYVPFPQCLRVPPQGHCFIVHTSTLPPCKMSFLTPTLLSHPAPQVKGQLITGKTTVKISAYRLLTTTHCQR